MNDISIDGKVLKIARERLEKIKNRYEQDNESRRDVAFRVSRRLFELKTEQEYNARTLVAKALSMNKEEIETLRARNSELRAEIQNELISHGLPTDQLDVKYHCDKCSDFGYIGTKMCSCLREIYNEELSKTRSELLKLSNETFEGFDLSYYSDEPDGKSPIPPRQSMTMNYNFCKAYAENFSKSSKNLFFSGGTGLGKTFLSACIAKVVAKKGYSVIYDSAYNVFSAMESEHFGKTDISDEGPNPSRRYFNCDLLILDDLGTEMTTSFTVSALYNIVNLRLLCGNPTIISSNLLPDPEKDIDDIARRYSPQIDSRIKGEYEILKFTGTDIRILKKNK